MTEANGRPDLHQQLAEWYQSLADYHQALANYHGVKAVNPLCDLPIPEKCDFVKKGIDLKE